MNPPKPPGTRVFWFHYNRPASQQKEKAQISLHYKETCHIVDGLKIDVPTHSWIRDEQPIFVVRGYCNDVSIDPVSNVATVS